MTKRKLSLELDKLNIGDVILVRPLTKMRMDSSLTYEALNYVREGQDINNLIDLNKISLRDKEIDQRYYLLIKIISVNSQVIEFRFDEKKRIAIRISDFELINIFKKGDVITSNIKYSLIMNMLTKFNIFKIIKHENICMTANFNKMLQSQGFIYNYGDLIISCQSYEIKNKNDQQNITFANNYYSVNVNMENLKHIYYHGDKEVLDFYNKNYV